MSTVTITLGDALRRVSGSIYNDLQVQLQMFPGLTPESRYLRLKFFVLKSKKKLFHLMAIVKWASASPSSIKSFFENLRAVHARIEDAEVALNEGQDHLYFLHRDLYWSRLKSADIAVAADIMGRGSYPYYPEAMLTCGRLPVPRATGNEPALLRDLGIYMRAKVCLHDRIPSTIDSSEVRDGCLLLRRRGLFELRLSLVDLSELSAWRVVGFEALVGYSPQEGLECELPPAITAAFCTGTLSALRSAAMRGADSSSGSGGALLDLTSRCMHTSQALALRYMYLSALELTRAEWQGYAEAAFAESADESVFSFIFWRSPSTSHFTMEVRWIQRRGRGAELGASLEVQLWTRRPLTDASDASAAQFECREVEGFFTSSACVDSYIGPGVGFAAFLSELLSRCSAHRACVLRRRLLASDPSGMGLTVERTPLGCSIRLGRASLDVHTDTRRGLYSVSLPAGAGLAPFAPLSAELNGLEGEEVSRSAILAEGLAGAEGALHTLDTLEVVSRQLYVLHWSSLLEGLLGVAGEPAAAPSTALLLARAGHSLDGRATVYRLRTWRSAAVHRKKLSHFLAAAFPQSLQRAVLGIPPLYPPPGIDASGGGVRAEEVVFSSEGIVREGARRRMEDGAPFTKRPRRSIGSSLAMAAHPLAEQLGEGDSSLFLLVSFDRDTCSANLSSMLCLNDYLQSVDIGPAPEPCFDIKALGVLHLHSSLDSSSGGGRTSAPYRQLSRGIAAATREAADMRSGYLAVGSTIECLLPPQPFMGGCDNIALCSRPADGCVVMLRAVGSSILCQFIIATASDLLRILGGSGSAGHVAATDEQCQQLLVACMAVVYECRLHFFSSGGSTTVAVNADSISSSSGERDLVLAQHLSNTLNSLNSSATSSPAAVCELLCGLLLEASATVLFSHAIYGAAAVAAEPMLSFTHSHPVLPGASAPLSLTFAVRPSPGAKIGAFLSVTTAGGGDIVLCNAGREAVRLPMRVISGVCADVLAGRVDSYKRMAAEIFGEKIK